MTLPSLRKLVVPLLLGSFFPGCHRSDVHWIGFPGASRPIDAAPLGEEIRTTPVPLISIAEAQEWTLDLSAHFSSSSPLKFACLERCPTGFSVQGSTGIARWTPAHGQAGTYTVVMTALAAGKSATLTLTFLVEARSQNFLFQISTPEEGQTLSSSTPLAAVHGKCSAAVVRITSSVAGSLFPSCSTTGTFTFLVSRNSSGSQTITFEAQTESGEKATATAKVTHDLDNPNVAITSPNAGKDFHTENGSVMLAGTCSQDVVTISSQPPLPFSDANCSDGTWAAGPFSPTWTQKLITVRATDKVGRTQSASMRILKALALGQPNATTLINQKLGLDTPQGVWTDGTRLVVADTNGNRVLIWNQTPSDGSTPPDVVLGQTGASDLPSALPSASTLKAPQAVFSDGTRLLVADSGNNRVLIWNTFPTLSGQAASIVLGQPDFFKVTHNTGGVSARSLSNPTGLWTDGTRLLVADESNFRVLLWENFPTDSFAPANLVLGQPNLETNVQQTLNNKTFAGPRTPWIEGTKLLVTDPLGRRILIWNTIPTVNYAASNVVLGQPDSASSTANNRGISAKSLYNPHGMVVAQGKLFVADLWNHRILVWNSIPTVPFTEANLVLGQPSLEHMTKNQPSGIPTAQGLHFPRGLTTDGQRLCAADSGNNRVLCWDILPGENAKAADRVIGQPGFSSGARFTGLPLPLSSNFNSFFVGSKFIITDRFHHRILIWNQFPQDETLMPDVVLGQPDLQQAKPNNGGVSAKSLNEPVSVASDGTRLLVTDWGNHRVLIWNTFPTENFKAADVVLGQANDSANTSSASQTRMYNPMGLALANLTGPDRVALYVSDMNNHRILYFDPIPAVTGTGATAVIGQVDFTASSANGGAGVSASSLSTPTGLAIDGGRLFVADSGNHRVLVWNDLPTSQAPASFALGQPGLTTRVENNGGVSGSSLNFPRWVAASGGRLAVSDHTNNRVLLWNATPTTSGAAADVALGKPSLAYNGDWSTVDASSTYPFLQQDLKSPWGVQILGDRVMVADQANGLVRFWNTWPTHHSTPSSFHYESQKRHSVSDGMAVSDLTVSRGGSAIVAAGKLIHVDTLRHRVLVWNSLPASAAAPADLVLGQPNSNSESPNQGGLTARSLRSPTHVWSDGTRLVVADTGNNRVLVWKNFPEVSYEEADIVLGQADFGSALANVPGVSLASMSAPHGVWVAGERLFVVDRNNNRILIWNTLPNSNGAPADVVVGQPDGTASLRPNRNFIDRYALALPQSVVANGEKMWVVDEANNRILVWNAIPATHGAPADAVLGQPSTSRTAYTETSAGKPSEKIMRHPLLMWLFGEALFVSDSGNHRVLGFTRFETFASASTVLFQPDFFSDDSGAGVGTVFQPKGVSVSDDVVVVTEVSRPRILIFAR